MKSGQTRLGMVAGVAFCAAAAEPVSMRLAAQQPPAAPNGGGVVAARFTLLDRDGDGAVIRDEMRSTFDEWSTRDNLRVPTTIDYARMSLDDKAKE